MKDLPWKAERPLKDEVVHDVKDEQDPEDVWIVKMTKRSAKLTVLIGLLFSSEHFLPSKVAEEPIIEFIYDGNALKGAITESREFVLAPEHMHPGQIGDEPVKIYSGPILNQVRYYTLTHENHEWEHQPQFSVNRHAYLMYIVLLSSLAQMILPLESFPRFGMWVVSIGCIVGYLLVYLSSSL